MTDIRLQTENGSVQDRLTAIEVWSHDDGLGWILRTHDVWQIENMDLRMQVAALEVWIDVDGEMWISLQSCR